MDNLTDLKAIWQTANTDSLPDAAEIVSLIKKFRTQRLRKKYIVIFAASAMVILMILVMFFYHSVMITTRIGELLIMGSSIVLAATNIRSLKRFYALNNLSNIQFLSFIEQTRLNQLYFYRKTQPCIFLLTAVGLLFYLYEPASHHPVPSAILYLVCIIYLLIMFLFVRPRFYKKEAAKLEVMRLHLEKISQQFQS